MATHTETRTLKSTLAEKIPRALEIERDPGVRYGDDVPGLGRPQYMSPEQAIGGK